MVTPKPKNIGSRMATIAFDTVAGDTLGPAWKVEVAKSVRIEGETDFIPWVEMNPWNFLQPD